MLRVTAITALVLAVVATALLWRQAAKSHDSQPPSLPAPPLEHVPGTVFVIPGGNRTGHRRVRGGVRVVVPSPGAGSAAAGSTTPQPANVVSPRPVAKPQAAQPHKRTPPPKTGPTPGTTPTTPVATPPAPVATPPAPTPPAPSGPPKAPAPPTPAAPPVTPPVVTPPSTPTRPVESHPGNGYGDGNHDHTGPPGQVKKDDKDGGGHGKGGSG